MNAVKLSVVGAISPDMSSYLATFLDEAGELKSVRIRTRQTVAAVLAAAAPAAAAFRGARAILLPIDV